MAKDIAISKSNRLAIFLYPFSPSNFSISLGLAGLANVWGVAASIFHLPSEVSVSLLVVAELVFWVLLGVLVMRLIVASPSARIKMEQLADPFNSLVPISGMLAAIEIESTFQDIARILFLAFLVATLFLGILTIRRCTGKSNSIPGDYLPLAAGGLVGVLGSAHLGFEALGWVCFGVGILSWLWLGSILLGNKISSLPEKMAPTLAIELAIPAMGGMAYFALTGNETDALAYLLLGYMLVLLFSQLRLVPLYRRLNFSQSFWAFTFPFASVSQYSILWIIELRPAGSSLLILLVMAGISLLIGYIAVRSTFRFLKYIGLPR